jgi:hypothetical protein
MGVAVICRNIICVAENNTALCNAFHLVSLLRGLSDMLSSESRTYVCEVFILRKMFHLRKSGRVISATVANQLLNACASKAQQKDLLGSPRFRYAFSQNIK